MATLSDPIASTIKLILMAASGEGKSSCIVPLSIPDLVKGWPGKRLFVLNMDGAGKFAELAKMQLDDRLARRPGLTPISQAQYDAALANIEYEDCYDPKKITRDSTGYNASIISADAWTKAKKALDKWYAELAKAPKGCIVVVDSFSHLAFAIANYTMALANRLNKPAEGFRDYGPAQQEIRAALGALTALPCHLIITAHQSAYEIKKMAETPERDAATGEMIFREEIMDSIMLPQSFGQSGRTEIPSTMNHLLFLSTNKNKQRTIHLTPGKGITPKTPYFARARKEYDIDKGLVSYFLLGEPSA